MSTILVLAGVNGAGKSSLLGSIATAEGLVWFDPDAFTRELEATGCPHDQTNSKAWEEGKNRLAHPSNLDELGMTPEWAAPIVERALQLHPPAWLEPDATRPPSL